MLPKYPSAYHQRLHPDEGNNHSVTYSVMRAFLRNKYGACNDPTNAASNETGGSANSSLRVSGDIVSLKSENTRDTKL